MHLATYVGLQHAASRTLADAFRQVAEGHAEEPDVHSLCHALAGMSDAHVERLAPVADRYGEQREESPSGCTPTGCPAPAPAASASYGTCRTCTPWRPSSTSPGRSWDKRRKGHATGSSWTSWTPAKRTPSASSGG
ncbi:hypothetical protein [Streptomyces glaucescens]|uniref:Uncharacterized protein n=1 Tax=Streptomyces glaucescens TaxID=1907 RepID=A0A089WZG0_STRGA|nr:hypothetical protein [Streptomyces glaucescens]AIR96143.1 hypothetical protein SGLAU_00575 [Streptomyces glaucescens]